MKKRYYAKSEYVYLVGIVIVLAIAFLTIGFSNTSVIGNIENVIAKVRVQRDIRLTHMSINNATNGAVSNWETVNVKTLAAGVSLPNSDSTISYNIKVTNIGNIEAMISNITNLPNNLTYTLEDYTLGDILCDDIDGTLCKLGSVSTITLTIGYTENGYDSSNTDYNLVLDFTFDYLVDSVAKVGDSYYSTLQKAINAVPNDKTETLIILLKNTSETITISNTKNIILNLNYQTVSNDQNKPVFANSGILTLMNGTITTNAATNGAVNNESSGTIVIDGVNIIVTGGRQALYNNKGTATIKGSSYLYSEASERAACQNVSGGKMYIQGGTIVSTNAAALNNLGTLTVGIKDGDVNLIAPAFIGTTYGITSTTNYSFYDGIVKATGSVFNDIAKITSKEDGVALVTGTEGDLKYACFAPAYTVTFAPNNTNVVLSEKNRNIIKGNPVGTLPVPSKSGSDFLGWFTAASGGEQINENWIINGPVTFYAHWAKTVQVAQIGNTIYDSLAQAVNASPNNTQTTITLLKDISETINISSAKNIIIDLNNHTITNTGNYPIFETSGTVTLTNGSLNSSATQAAINNTGGHLIVNNCRIVETSNKQAMYITGGLVEITGNSYLSSQTYGTPDNSTMERGTVQVISGSLIVTGGTIVGTKQQAISNEGTLTIGVKDGVIDSTAPVLIGEGHGIRSMGTLNFYDGIVKGKNDAIYGNVDDQEVNSQIVIGSEMINNVSHVTAHLELAN